MAAQSAYNLEVIKLLLKNGADINVPNREGLTAFHLLLANLLDLTALENKRGPNTDERLEEEILKCFEALQLIAGRRKVHKPRGHNLTKFYHS